MKVLCIDDPKGVFPALANYLSYDMFLSTGPIINGFLKKSANTPKKELQKAMRIRKEYFTNIIDSN